MMIRYQRADAGDPGARSVAATLHTTPRIRLPHTLNDRRQPMPSSSESAWRDSMKTNRRMSLDAAARGLGLAPPRIKKHIFLPLSILYLFVLIQLTQKQ
jgi:hypothetical protein